MSNAIAQLEALIGRPLSAEGQGIVEEALVDAFVAGTDAARRAFDEGTDVASNAISSGASLAFERISDALETPREPGP